jgi:AcrR family transcriptional regulator
MSSMRVSREQAEANREKILEVAGTLFRERGFDGTAVDDIMRRAGLTHGGFLRALRIEGRLGRRNLRPRHGRRRMG